MRAVSKADYGKGGNIPSYEVLRVVTDGGEFKPDEMYFHNYDEDTEHLCWEERRADFAKSAMNGILANREMVAAMLQSPNPKGFEYQVVRISISFVDALIAELKKKGE